MSTIFQSFSDQLTCDDPKTHRFTEPYCSARRVASIRPSLFKNRTQYDARVVTYPPSDPWIPILAYSTRREEAEALGSEILFYHSAYAILPWLFFISALFYLGAGIMWERKENGKGCSVEPGEMFGPFSCTILPFQLNSTSCLFKLSYKDIF